MRTGTGACSSHLVMWKLVQKAAFIDMLCLQNDISIAASTRSGNNILEESGRNEEDDDKQVNNGANGAGAFWNFLFVGFGHVDALQASLDKVGTGPHDQRIGGSEGEAAQSNGGNNGRALANGLVEDCCACSRNGVQRESLGVAEACRGHVGMLGRRL